MYRSYSDSRLAARPIAAVGNERSGFVAQLPEPAQEDLANAWAYARQHREEIEQQIVDNETA